ncbi:triose-phosphate isomerase family protein [Sporolactobacillus sp. KGMB 08714]|uniref:triose-phosphate isomerase family protein n=1 Tax=Sporolactobacillus sp. KGMB 08714 TaxID=3064704 RepID=UPI002FBDA99D
MKYIHVNLKRFDIQRALGGVNDYALSEKKDWAQSIMVQLNATINQFSSLDYQFVFYLPEAYILTAQAAKSVQSPIKIGCQSVFRHDTFEDGNIGAYTTMRPASAMTGLGVHDTIIGHSEERAAKLNFLRQVSADDDKNLQAIHDDLQAGIQMAQHANMRVLYCVGESAAVRDDGSWKDVIKAQLNFDSDKINLHNLKIAYEPIWAIGPNRPVPDGNAIEAVAAYIHELIGADIPILYGGGLKETNAQEIAGLPDIDGGLIALTNFSERIGFYPDQFIDIAKKYASGVASHEKI